MEQQKSAKNDGLSLKKRRRLDQMCLEVAEHIFSQEGEGLVERLSAVVEKIKTRQNQVNLSPQEIVALSFIQSEIGQGRSPTVRVVAKMLNVKSSRTAHRVIQGLIGKGALHRYRLTLTSTPSRAAQTFLD